MQVRILAASATPVFAVSACLLVFAPAATAQERRVSPQASTVRLPGQVGSVAAEIDSVVEAIKMLTEQLSMAMEGLERVLANEPQRPDPSASDESLATWGDRHAEWEARVGKARSNVATAAQRLQAAQRELDRLRAELASAERQLDRASRELHRRRITGLRDYADHLTREVGLLNEALMAANRGGTSPDGGEPDYSEAVRRVGRVQAAAASGIPIG